MPGRIPRRMFLGGLLLSGVARSGDGFRPLFDGVSLRGWKRQPRSLAEPSLGRWTVEDGVIVGGQDPPGSGVGSYLDTEETFGNFKLHIGTLPDSPTSTVVLVGTGPKLENA